MFWANRMHKTCRKWYRTIGRQRQSVQWIYLFKFFEFSNIDSLCLILTIFIQPIFNLLKPSNQRFLLLWCDKIVVLVVELNTRKSTQLYTAWDQTKTIREFISIYLVTHVIDISLHSIFLLLGFFHYPVLKSHLILLLYSLFQFSSGQCTIDQLIDWNRNFLNFLFRWLNLK